MAKKIIYEFRKFYNEHDFVIYYTAEFENMPNGIRQIKLSGRINQPLFHPLITADIDFDFGYEMELLLASAESHMDSNLDEVLRGATFFAIGEMMI